MIRVLSDGTTVMSLTDALSRIANTDNSMAEYLTDCIAEYDTAIQDKQEEIQELKGAFAKDTDQFQLIAEYATVLGNLLESNRLNRKALQDYTNRIYTAAMELW